MEENRKMHAGDLNVSVQSEEVVWTDRTRKTIFALPWSFTKYSLTPSRLIVERGLLSKKEDEIRLYRIRDVGISASLYERITGTGTIRLVSSDSSLPELVIRRIKNAHEVKAVLSQYVENSRRQNGVRTSELVGGGGMHHHPGDGCFEGHESFGPDIVPDLNHDGIDDRLQ